MNYSKTTFLLLALTIVASPMCAGQNLNAKQADKKEVRHSMIGIRNTLIFYIFRNQQAVMTLTIDNKDETFPIKGKMYLFDGTVMDKDLAKWVNNRHSDALFADAPKPVSTIDLPKNLFKVSSFKKTETVKNPRDQSVFQTYEVQFSVKKYAVEKKFTLSAFTDKTKVQVKSK